MARLKKINNAQTAYFCEQLWLMLNSGMQLNDGLDILSEDLEDSTLREISNFLSDKICEGNTLHQAMVDSGAFPNYAVNMVKIGAVSGRLDDVLKGLSEYYENRSEMENTVRYAVVHPTVLLVMMAAVMAVLVIKVIPMFESVFAQFSADVGATISGSIHTAQTVGRVSMIVLIAVVAIAAVVYLAAPVRRAALAVLARIPFTAAIASSFELAKVTDALSMMISSGIDPEDSLEYALTLVSQKRMKQRLSDCLKRVQEGEFFVDAIAKSGILPSVYSRSLKIAYTSGSFETVWRKISGRCSDEAQRSAVNLIAVIEPVIIVLLAVMIGAVLLTIMLPLMNIMSVLG